jgi:transcriptional regulator with XRE-family HTH domain
MASTNPTVRQRELGKRLRDLRNERDLTVEDVAERLLCTTTKISRLETGVRRPSLRDIRDLCALYGVDGSTSAELIRLARETHESSWWIKYEDLNLNPYIGLEQTAAAITSYTMYYIPALLQTADYARAIIKGIARRMDQKIFEQRVEARLRRQQLLEPDNRPRYHALMDEAVLHRRVGGPALMADQLTKVLEAEHSGKVAVRIIPFDIGAHAAQDSNFILFEFDEVNLSPVVFVEGLTGNRYLERPTDVGRYREALEYLRGSALSPGDSIRMLTELQRTYASM